MIPPLAFLPLLSAAVLGWLAVSLWTPDAGGRSPWAPALRASLGIGFGIGITSCIYFLLLAGGAASMPVVLGVEGLALLICGALYYRRRRANPALATDVQPAVLWIWALGIAGAAMSFLFIASFLNSTQWNPQGGWDAFAIWNLRARFLLHSDTWRFAITTLPTGTHMEYPLLLSSAVARGWLFSGEASAAVPIVIALLFPLALALVLTSAVAVLRGAAAGLLAGMILFANQFLWSAAADQYADLPLAFFGLASAAVLMLDETPLRSPRFLTLAGCFAGLAAWTKNEGVLLLVALTAALLAIAWRSAGPRQALRHAGFFLLGALPLLALVLWFKLFAAPPDTLVAGMGDAVSHKVVDGGRWFSVLAGFVKTAPLVPLALLAFAAVLLRPRSGAFPAMLPLIAFAIALAGDFTVFLLTRLDVEWLISTALERLYLQLWPLLVLAVFLLLRRPEDFAIAAPAQVPRVRRR